MGWFGFRMFDRLETAYAEISFEAAGTDFYYYPDNGSLGIRVSAVERQLFIEGPQRQFFQSIDGRPATGPRRSRRRLYARSLAVQPAGLDLLFGVMGMFAMRDAMRSEAGMMQTILFATAALFVSSAALRMVARQWLGKSESASRQS